MYNFPLSVGVYFSLLVGPGGPKDDDDDDHGFLRRHGQSIIRARFTWTEPQKNESWSVVSSPRCDIKRFRCEDGTTDRPNGREEKYVNKIINYFLIDDDSDLLRARAH